MPLGVAQQLKWLRYECLCLAQLAQRAERYDDMVEAMEKVITSIDPEELFDEELMLLTKAYNLSILKRRDAWRVVTSSQEQELENCTVNPTCMTKELKAKIESEVSGICSRILDYLDTYMIPNSKTARCKVSLLKLKGDMHRHLAEFQLGAKSKDVSDQTYKLAYEIARKELPAANLMRLELAVSFSSLCYEVLSSPIRAVTVARNALQQALLEISKRRKEYEVDVLRNVEHLSHNIKMWTGGYMERNKIVDLQ